MADPAAGQPRLDWSTAEVSDGQLVVELEGELPKGWPKSFDATAHLLDRGQWEKVKVKKGSIRVTGVSAGDEEKLRHFLESVVQQANADHDQTGDVDQQGDAEPDDAESGDAAMTERFRAFSDAGSDPGEADGGGGGA